MLPSMSNVRFQYIQTHFLDCRMHRTRAIVERGRYNAEDSLLREKETILIDQKQSLVQLRQRQEDWKVTQLKRAHQSTLKYI